MILSNPESDISGRKSAKALHAQNWMAQLDKYAHEIWKDNADGWVTGSKNKPRANDASDAKLPSGER